jgi:lactoylglutathione lyase
MPFRLTHNNFNVFNLGKDLAFYKEALHKKMRSICFENKAMDIYLIHDPDDDWRGIIPRTR